MPVMNVRRTIACLVLYGFSGVSLAQQIPAGLLEKYQNMTPEQQQAARERAKQAGYAVPGQSAAVPANVAQPAPSDSSPMLEPGVVNRKAAPNTRGKESTTQAENSANETISNKLKPFGYELFYGTPTTFAPATDIPVSKDYVLGPGDVIEVQLFGKQNQNYSLMVQRDGSIQFPEFGPIQVVGLPFDSMREMLQLQISKRMIGVQSSITMGPLRSIRVFVLGDAQRPGSYSVSSLSTITNALFVSGGIAETGSLRRIQLKRQGRLVTTLDLYDLLLRGDTSRDARLEPGDVIFVPPLAGSVGISGEVRRPALYEMLGPMSAIDLVVMAGGMISTAFPAAARIDRIEEANLKSVLDLDLTTDKKKTQLRDGDVLRVPSVLDRVEDAVFARGHFNRPDAFKWRQGIRLSDVIRSAEDLKPVPDLDFGLIVRESKLDRTIAVLPYSPADVLSQPNSVSDLELQARDVVYTFGLGVARNDQLGEVVEQLRVQSRKSGVEEVVRIAGEVHAPGLYPRYEGMTVSDLIGAGLNLTEDADNQYAVLIRENPQTRELAAISVRPLKALSGEQIWNIPLQAKDALFVFNARAGRSDLLDPVLDRLKSQATQAVRAQIVQVQGAVRFPGSYPLSGEMTLAELVGMAGGLAEPAYTLTAEVSRETLDQQKGYVVAPISVGLPTGLDDEPSFRLAPGDRLTVRRIPKYIPAAVVTLEGEVRFPGEYRIQEDETLGSLIARAGGLSEEADPNNSFFSRESLRATEAQQITLQRQQLERDLARFQIEQSTKLAADPKAAAASQFIQGLAYQLADVQPQGRMAIDLPGILKGEKGRDIPLRAGDYLRIGKRPAAVSVFGEVLYPTSHQYRKGHSISDYIALSGGTTQSADDGRTYIIRANGEIIGSATGSFGWGASLKPGDTVVVPFDLYRVDPLLLTTNIVQIVANLAITAASLNAAGAF